MGAQSVPLCARNALSKCSGEEKWRGGGAGSAGGDKAYRGAFLDSLPERAEANDLPFSESPRLAEE